MSDTNSQLAQFDNLLAADGPAALVVREHLIPVEGADAVLFPATYADIGYNIDYENQRERTGRNVCLVDSVGSQANRIEPLFKDAPYAALVPQVVIKAGDKEINLLDAGHRAGDALARCSALQDELKAAFTAVLKGNAVPLAKIAPTSLVFGVWDSRDTQAKLPRLTCLHDSRLRCPQAHPLRAVLGLVAAATPIPSTTTRRFSVPSPTRTTRTADPPPALLMSLPLALMVASLRTAASVATQCSHSPR